MSDFQSSQFAQSLNQFAEIVEANAVSKGFRQGGIEDNRESVAVLMTNLHGEVSELWEAFRAGKLRVECDKADKMREVGVDALTCAEEEIADIFIRLLDTSRALGIDVGRAVLAKHRFNTTRPHLHGGKKA